MSKFDIKDKIDVFIYTLYNFASDVTYGLNSRARSIVRQNVSYKDMHVGQRCFILGTGPSLNKLSDREIDALGREVVFGVNSLYKSRIGERLNPKYYALMDNLYWEQWSGTFSEVLSKYKSAPPVFITDIRAKGVVDSLSEVVRAIYMHPKKYPTKRMSAEIDKNIYAAMNVISYSILSAIYMGFKEIYLLGCDYSAFCTAGQGHCYDDESELDGFNYNLAFYLKFYWITTEFHYLISRLSKEAQVRVINLTPGSLLDAYPRVSIESVI